MARKRSSQPDEGQFSLDDFINQDPVDAESVPEMIDLSPQTEPVEAKTAESKPLRTFTMPSSETANEQPPTPPSSDIFHNLGKMYPNPPIPMDDSGMVLHRATLYDITGIDTLLDWVSDGDAALVEMERLINREHEFKTVLARLHRGRVRRQAPGNAARRREARGRGERGGRAARVRRPRAPQQGRPRARRGDALCRARRRDAGAVASPA